VEVLHREAAIKVAIQAQHPLDLSVRPTTMLAISVSYGDFL
jgi:hypothetical protein